MIAWMRKLIVTLVADYQNGMQRFLTIGETSDEQDALSISITGTKYLSPMKDEFAISIKNIPVESDKVSMLQIKDTNFKYITIEAGYEENSEIVFNGYIVYISSKLEDNGKTVNVSIVCSGSYTFNSLHGKTYTIRKGTTYRTALLSAARVSGIHESQISLSSTLLYKRLQKDTTYDGSLMSMIIELQNQDKNLLCHCDFTSKSKFQVWDATLQGTRELKMNTNNIMLTNGFPTIEDQGIRFTCLPILNLIPGDEIIISEDSFINRSIDSLSSYMSTPYPDVFVGAVSPLETDPEKIKEIEAVKGHYIIKELRYKLENRGHAFEMTVKCYAKSLYKALSQNWN